VLSRARFTARFREEAVEAGTSRKPFGAVARRRLSTGLVSSSNFAATSTDSDDTAASTAQVPAWAFVFAWSAEEPHRAGEESFAPSPRPGRELFAGTLLSRRQLLLRATADAVEVEVSRSRLSKRANGPFVSRNATSFAMSIVDAGSPLDEVRKEGPVY
jgi:hypothetical protein